MKAKFTIFLVFLITQSIWGNSQRQPVYVDKIDIRTEVVGLFTKNIVEVIFHNPNEIDSLEATWSFSANRNSFVKDMWLEIDGQLKKAETFSEGTGSRIYERITGKRLDPRNIANEWQGTLLFERFSFCCQRVSPGCNRALCNARSCGGGLCLGFSGTSFNKH